MTEVKTVTVTMDAERFAMLAEFASKMLRSGDELAKAKADWDAERAVNWSPEVRATRRAEVVAARDLPRSSCGCCNPKMARLSEAFEEDNFRYSFFKHQNLSGFGYIAESLMPDGLLDALRAVTAAEAQFHG